LKDSIQGTEILGDLYAMAIQCSKINLGILSEQRVGSSSGDLITSRTFHIPGASGFMLHERNEESLKCFEEGTESGFFEGPEEMVSQIKKYLPDAALRDKIRMAGHRRALAEHSLDARAETVMGYLKDM
jgi:spore maturation protein CgeB